MLKIEDGSLYFHQWDTNQRLFIDNESIVEVHFSNSNDNEAMVCSVYEENGIRYANVPNILLQSVWTIKAYAVCSECKTRAAESFIVMQRAKPADYVYTETEVKRYETLEQRIADIEQSDFATVEYVDEAIKDVETGSVDLEGYATEKYVDDAIKKIPATDLSNYYTKSQTDAAIKSAKPDMTGYATESYVNNKIAAIPPTDLSNYYTIAQTNSAINAAKPDLSQYAKKSEIPSVTGLASETYVNNAIAAIPPTDLSNYYTKTQIDNKGYLTAHQDLSAYAKKTDIPSLTGYATETYVNDAIADIDLPEAIQGEKGERGHSILKVTTAPSSYTTAIGGKNPIKRMALSTIKTQANVDEVQVGDQIYHSYYMYNVYYIDSSYAYIDVSQSIRGSAGSAGKTPVKGTDYYTEADKTEMKNSVLESLNDETWVFTLKDGTTVSKKVVLQ